jgi:hypothetical protein
MKDLPEGWTSEEWAEYACCGYVSFKSEAEIDAWCEMAVAESMTNILASEAAAQIGHAQR